MGQNGGTTKNSAPSWEEFLKRYNARHHELADLMKKKIEQFQTTLESDKAYFQAAESKLILLPVINYP